MTPLINPNPASRHGQGQNELNQEVARLCGWKHKERLDSRGWIWKRGQEIAYGDCNLPSYVSDLNACHEAWKDNIEGEAELEDKFSVELAKALGIPNPCDDGRPNLSDADLAQVSNAPAEQRCRAFVATMEGRSVGDGTEKHPAAPGSPKSASGSGSASMEGANK